MTQNKPKELEIIYAKVDDTSDLVGVLIGEGKFIETWISSDLNFLRYDLTKNLGYDYKIVRETNYNEVDNQDLCFIIFAQIRRMMRSEKSNKGVEL